ncbi:MAG: RES family NAD+ phosphorylase [Steroidobacteraceae bacterium]
MEFHVTNDSVGDWYRNVVSLRASVDLFADLVRDPRDAQILAEHELATKPARRPMPIVSRPFEDAALYDPLYAAIAWPFKHPCSSRYSSGAFGVWYGADTLVTSVHETVHHFRGNTLASRVAAQSPRPIYQERRVHRVRSSAMLIDLRIACREDPRFTDPDDYAFCQTIGKQLQSASQPGVESCSVRHREGVIVGVFRRDALSDPRDVCYLTYVLHPDSGHVDVERTPGKAEWHV